MPSRISNTALYLSLGIAALLVYGIFFSLQAPISVNSGFGWDGYQYYVLSNNLKNYGLVVGEIPYCYRILLPAICAYFPTENIKSNYEILNGIACILCLWMLIKVLKTEIDNNWYILAAGLFYCCQFMMPIRHYIFYPVMLDYWSTAAFFVCLYLLQIPFKELGNNKRWIWFLLVFFGTLLKDFIVLMPLFLFTKLRIERTLAQSCQYNKKEILGFILPLFSVGLIALIIPYYAVDSGYSTTDYHLLSIIKNNLRSKTIIEIILSYYNILGLTLVLFIWRFKKLLEVLGKQPIYLLLLAYNFCMVLLMGSDSERFICWFIPVYLILLFKILKDDFRIKDHPFSLSLIGIGLLFSCRLFWLMPTQQYPSADGQFAAFSIFGDGVSYLMLQATNLRSMGYSDLLLTSFLQYLIASIIVVLVLFLERYFSQRSMKRDLKIAEN